MRMYEIQNKRGRIIGYARSFDQAKAIVKEDDPSARKTQERRPIQRPLNSVNSGDTFSNGMSIMLIDIKADKEGVITLLNSILSQQEPEPVEKTTEQVVIETALSGALFPAPEEVEEVVKSSKPCQQWDAQTQSYVSVDDYVNAEDTGYVGVIPATEYKVDDLNFPKKGKGRCLHCKKLVGYVGGFPSVNPPDAICD